MTNDGGQGTGGTSAPKGLSRRQALAALAVLPAVAVLEPPVATVERASRAAADALARRAPYVPKFFTRAEWRTVRMLADYVIPRDERSGSATDAGVPEFMDFIMTDFPSMQVPMRGGLAWLDGESRRRWGKSFVAATDAERRAVLDDIAYPKKAPPALSHGVAFFNRFRDLTASGFFSSKIGVADLGYTGNTFVAEWKGCPEAALAKLGVRYDE